MKNIPSDATKTPDSGVYILQAWDSVAKEWRSSASDSLHATKAAKVKELLRLSHVFSNQTFRLITCKIEKSMSFDKNGEVYEVG